MATASGRNWPNHSAAPFRQVKFEQGWAIRAATGTRLISGPGHQVGFDADPESGIRSEVSQELILRPMRFSCQICRLPALYPGRKPWALYRKAKPLRWQKVGSYRVITERELPNLDVDARLTKKRRPCPLLSRADQTSGLDVSFVADALRALFGPPPLQTTTQY